MSLAEIRQFAPRAEADVFDWLSVEHSVRRRQSTGGTAPARVKEALAQAAQELGMEI